MQIKREIIINKNVNDVWEVMGTGFSQIHIWASYFKNSQPIGEKKFDGIDFSGRDTVVEGGKNIHTIDVFDSVNYFFTYTVTDGVPPFANKAGAEWSLKSIDEHSCKALICVNIELKDIIPPEKEGEINASLCQVADNMLEEMKYYVETGKVHSRKAKNQ